MWSQEGPGATAAVPVEEMEVVAAPSDDPEGHFTLVGLEAMRPSVPELDLSEFEVMDDTMGLSFLEGRDGFEDVRSPTPRQVQESPPAGDVTPVVTDCTPLSECNQSDTFPLQLTKVIRSRPSSPNDANTSNFPLNLTGSTSRSGSIGSGLTPNQTRACPTTVQWLLDNYETAEGMSLPRSTLYSHYLQHCHEYKLDPVIAATLGKLLRCVFLGLRTRRLGTRGNSKYHYYGIMVKPTSPLNQQVNESSTGEDGNGAVDGQLQVRGGQGQVTPTQQQGGQTVPTGRQQPPSQKKFNKPAGAKTEYDGNATGGAGPHNSGSDSTSPQHHQYLGDPTGAVPPLPEIDTDLCLLPDSLTQDDVDTFRSMYGDHCESLLEAVTALKFTSVEQLWRQFWRGPNNNKNSESECEKALPKAKLYMLCKLEPVQKFVRSVDYQFYQNLVDVLIADVLRPIPSALAQAISNFAKRLEKWMNSAMKGSPKDMLQVKVSAVSAFALTLQRYTSLNDMAQAARAILKNATQINQMVADLNQVDFPNVRKQASWICQCKEGLLSHLEADFQVTLKQQKSLEQWAAWLEGVVNRVLKPHEGKPDFGRAAQQFLLKWSFYSSTVIKDLTLRSAASFGSFHLILLLNDEYMCYLIEQRVASATGEIPIMVMSEKPREILMPLPPSPSSLGSINGRGVMSNQPPPASPATTAGPEDGDDCHTIA